MNKIKINEATKTTTICAAGILLMIPITWIIKNLYPYASRTATWTINTASQKISSLIDILYQKTTSIIKLIGPDNIYYVTMVVLLTAIIGLILVAALDMDGTRHKPRTRWSPKTPEEKGIRIETIEHG